jgi:hypothetical protein
MKNLKKSISENWLLFVLISILFGLNIYTLLRHDTPPTNKGVYVVADPEQKIKSIESYLDSISSSYLADEQLLAKQRNIPSWGCGPSSYALAKIINTKFFDNELPITASYKSDYPNQIVERFSLAGDDTSVVDHAWLEIYLGDKFLYVDPTIGQFGKINSIAYRVFSVGQSDIGSILKNDYGIRDVRLTLLVPKVVNRIPKDQPPYPGATISDDAINYFLKSLEERNIVDEGSEPPEWKEWVSFLTQKYI